MPRRPDKSLPANLPRERVHAALARLGFEKREGGNHTVFVDPNDRSRRVVIPRHPKVKGLLLRRNLQDTGVSEADFMAAYR